MKITEKRQKPHRLLDQLPPLLVLRLLGLRGVLRRAPQLLDLVRVDLPPPRQLHALACHALRTLGLLLRDVLLALELLRQQPVQSARAGEVAPVVTASARVLSILLSDEVNAGRVVLAQPRDVLPRLLFLLILELPLGPFDGAELRRVED